jgi:hypothetical protein
MYIHELLLSGSLFWLSTPVSFVLLFCVCVCVCVCVCLCLCVFCVCVFCLCVCVCVCVYVLLQPRFGQAAGSTYRGRVLISMYTVPDPESLGWCVHRPLVPLRVRAHACSRSRASLACPYARAYVMAFMSIHAHPCAYVHYYNIANITHLHAGRRSGIA